MAGRPKGTKDVFGKDFREHFTWEDIQKLTRKALSMAEKGNETMLKFILEKIYGKAVQPLGNTLDDNGKIQPLLVQFLNGKPNENSIDTGRVQETV